MEFDFDNLDPMDKIVLGTWLAFEAQQTGNYIQPPVIPAGAPHPNEVATRAAVEAGHYTAEDVGLGPT